MKIALFGGAFDPPHLGHQRIAQEMIGHALVDEVWFVPVFKHPWEDRLGKWYMAAYEHRKMMVELILLPHTHLYEYLNVSFTYPTLLQVAKNHPEDEFSWIIGSDNLPTFGDWDCCQKIINEFKVFAYPRKGFPLKQFFAGINLLDDFPEIDVSSTMVKEKLKQGESISKLVDAKIAQYIQNNHLYT